MSVPSEKIPTLWECYKEQFINPFNISDRFKYNCDHKFGLIFAFIMFVIMSIICYVKYKQTQKDNEGKDDEDKDNNTQTILILVVVVILVTVISYFLAKYGYRWKVTVNNAIGRTVLGIKK